MAGHLKGTVGGRGTESEENRCAAIIAAVVAGADEARFEPQPDHGREWADPDSGSDRAQFELQPDRGRELADPDGGADDAQFELQPDRGRDWADPDGGEID